ncbi:MAG: hypothetical protein OHK006_14510 [Thermodesulfovibrionales bacterium]
MKKLFAMLLLLLLAAVASRAEGQTVTGPDVRLNGSDLYVTTSLNLDGRHLQQLRNGIEKELRIYIDLFRVWSVWPDEFVLGKSYVRTLKADQVKKEYVATSSDGNVMTTRRFKSFESMLEWTVSVKDLKLTNVRELEPGKYFVKVTVESKVRKLPPVFSYLFLFISENEFKVSSDSAPFAIEAAQ